MSAAAMTSTMYGSEVQVIASSGGNWVNPENVLEGYLGDAKSVVVIGSTTGKHTDWICAYNWVTNSAPPPGSKIDGVEIVATGKKSSTGYTIKVSAQLRRSLAVLGSKSDFATLTTYESHHTAGGATDMLGTSLKLTEVDFPFLQACIRYTGAQSCPSSCSRDVMLDRIRLKIYYSVDTARCTPPSMSGGTWNSPCDGPVQIDQLCQAVTSNGYVLSGSEFATCTASGAMSRVVTFNKIDNYCAIPSSSSIKFDTPCTGRVDESCQPSCALGWSVANTHVITRTCQPSTPSSGVWDTNPWTPQCTTKIASYCPDIEASSPTQYGSYACTGRRLDDTCTLSCNFGYRTTAASPPPPLSVTCVASTSSVGTWNDPSLYACEIKPDYCADDMPGSGVVSMETGCARTLGASCRPKCLAGYGDPNSYLCSAGNAALGTWGGGSSAICGLLNPYCDSRFNSVPTNGAAVVKSDEQQINSILTLTCNFGYEADANGNTRHGVGCVLKPGYCSPLAQALSPSPPGRGAPTAGCEGKLGESCTFICDDGFVDVSTPPYTCLLNDATGVWDGTPLCDYKSNYCASLGTTPNGVVSYVPTSRQLGTIASLDCDHGYATVGTVSRTCDALSSSSGRWSGTQNFACDLIEDYCTLFAVADFTYDQGCDNELGDTCAVTCSLGYANTNAASSPYTCLASNETSGVWSGAPSCELIDGYCSTLPSVPNAAPIAYTNNRRLGATASLSCNTGYVAVATPGTTKTCQADTAASGTWSGSGNFECVKIVEYCLALTGADGSEDSPCSHKVDELCFFNCDDGYFDTSDPAGSGYTCEASGPSVGMWSALPECTTISNYCPQLPVPANAASMVNTSRSLGGVASLVCANGYQPVGVTSRTCETNGEVQGKWSGNVDFGCAKIPVFCTLPSDIHGAGALDGPVGISCGSEIGDECHVTCDPGYRSQVLVNASRTCADVGGQGPGNGGWLPAAFPVPLCVPLPCRNLPLLGNGTLVPQYGAVTLDTVDATCNEGYTLVGEAVLACEADPLDTIWSAWSAPVPYCEPNNCTASEVPVDGYVVPSLVISTDAWVSYGCDPGFELWGNTARRCLPSGELSGTLPSCEPVLCPTNFTAPGNGTMVPGSGGAVTRDSVTFACNNGYFFVGQTVRTCEQGNATVPNAWSHSDYLKCIGQPCYPKLEDPINGKVSTHFGEFQDIARYECNAGYELNGNVTRMCASWGNWTVTPPVCDPLPCPTVIQPLNQDMLYFDSDESKTVLDGMTTDLHHVMCKAGFVFSPGVHELAMQCLPAPNNPAYPLAVDWFPQLLTCIPLACPPLSAPANGQVSAAGGVTRDTATYTCDPGYYIAERGDQMVYQMTVTCLPDTRALSRWSEPQPRCVKMPNYCPSVGPADNGQISLSVPSPSLEWGNDEWITASACTEALGDGCGKFVCNAGFQRVGPATIECTVGAQQVGLWSPELPSAAERCEPCPEGTYKSFSARDAAEWQCIPCPLGGYCAGGGSIPIASPGWWQNPDTGGFLTCVPMTNCLQGACRGGHRGFKCELCENGWYKKDGTNCVVCPPAKQVVYPILIVLAICLCVLLVKLARKSTHYFASLAVGASFLQMISILPSFGIKWPNFVKSFFNVFQILALNLSQFFEPQCMVDQGSSPFLLVWAIKMSLPLIFSAIFLFGGGLASVYYLIRKCVPTRKLEQCSPRLAGWFPELSKLGLKVVLWSCLNAFLTCLVLCYIVLTSAALSIFGCTRQADGTLTMNAEPAMTCKSKTWNNMVAVSVVALLLYGVGFPATVFWVLRTRRYSLWKEKNVIRYGLLYQRYLRKFYLYELVLIVRKFLFVFGKALFPGSPQAQIIWAMCTVLLGSGVQYVLAPFRDRHINWLEQLHLVSAAFILMLGVVFDATASSMSESGRTTLGIIIICVIVINIVVIGVAVGMALRVQYKLMRHGVSGGYASDELRVMPIFFKFDMRIVERQRRVTPHSILWTLELTTKRPLPLATTLLRDSIALGATVEEVLHNVEGEPERYARVEQSEDLMTTYAWYLIPCRGVYSARLLVDGERVSELVARGTYTEDEQAALEQALSSENAELAKFRASRQRDTLGEVELHDTERAGGKAGSADVGIVVDFSLASEFGVREFQQLHTPTAEYAMLGAMMASPVQYVLDAGRATQFAVSVPKASGLYLFEHADGFGSELGRERSYEELAEEFDAATAIPMFISSTEYRVQTLVVREGFVSVWAELRSEESLQNWRGLDVQAETRYALLTKFKVLPPGAGISQLSELEQFRDETSRRLAREAVWSAHLGTVVEQDGECVELAVFADDGASAVERVQQKQFDPTAMFASSAAPSPDAGSDGIELAPVAPAAAPPAPRDASPAPPASPV
ncbi:uncharacterized protein AMSG_01814 [Thecamonas trahens ATCC 50062]|uniref:Sushi domain-containing protein n=1 Tax=Thecamonas trahens ATCC 50062 TaxID=461836 RepID=A0A0L0DU25_THETB|nr:hypothetical protein AMSG_01814 [Thecamonas trahens ATCC 50062]KNC55551.1 hypothetical protein AMSG_01814 [Thecamonas trahens ATCC 50062]|eukprot:XP_013761325.1 hypothetical protein AMSG_01814 [Thecamonas trahens ATCC 50062]